MVDDPVQWREGFDSRFDADGSRREAQRDQRGGTGGAEMGKGVDLLFQVAAKESEAEAERLTQPSTQSDEGGRRQPDYFMPVKRA